MAAVSFFLAGVPVPKGSAKGFLHKTTGRVIVTAANAKTKPWEQAVRAQALAAGLRPVPERPVVVSLRFVMPRLKGHLRRDGSLRPDAPDVPACRPDVDKLSRTILDGLTGVAYVDDGQVATLEACKVYGAVSGVHVTVEIP